MRRLNHAQTRRGRCTGVRAANRAHHDAILEVGSEDVQSAARHGARCLAHRYQVQGSPGSMVTQKIANGPASVGGAETGIQDVQ